MGMGKLFNILKIIIINVLIFFIILFLVEAVVRYYHPEINSVGEDGNLIDYLKTIMPLAPRK